MTIIRSPISWVGGKFYSADKIVDAFPAPSDYDVYCEPFGGAAHILYAKPKHGHLEAFNDLNADLINFWMIARERGEELQEALDTLPYSRQMYYNFWHDLRNGTYKDNFERALLWFYVQRCGIGGQGTLRSSSVGWGYHAHGMSASHAFHSAIDLITHIKDRFRDVQIDSRDFADIIEAYGHNKRSLTYCDPPYIGAESYYKASVGVFDMADHERLAKALNAPEIGYVALSYYDHEKLDEWYPRDKWHRMKWKQYKHAEKLKDEAPRQTTEELLLMNYGHEDTGIWQNIR